MAALDWIFAAVLLASMLVGAWRGLVFEVLSLVGWVVSFFVAQWFAEDMAALLPMGESAEALRYAAGFVVVFVASVFACGSVPMAGIAKWGKVKPVCTSPRLNSAVKAVTACEKSSTGFTRPTPK